MIYPGKRESLTASPTPAIFSLAKEEEEARKESSQDGTHDQMLAADYDPSLDRREDEQRRVLGVKEEPAEAVQVVEEEEEEEEDVDDMFAIATTDKKKVKKIKRVIVCDISVVYRSILITCCRNLLLLR